MIRALIALAANIVPAATDPLVSSAPTATWFADHPHERAAIVAICNDNPGPARTDARCAAAWQGNIIAAEREARRHFGDRTPPSDTRYWIQRPEERREHLATCNRVSPEEAARIWCPQARAAEQRANPPADPQPNAIQPPPRARRT